MKVVRFSRTRWLGLLTKLNQCKGHMCKLAVAVWLSLLFVSASPGEAAADFKLCNKTGSHVGIAIGYKDQHGWTTEGWWNVAPSTCEVLLAGALVSRYYYIYATDYDLGGEWAGKAYMCTQDKMFTIRGINDCTQRGYGLTGFLEIDTGDQRSWTVQLSEPAQQGTGGR